MIQDKRKLQLYTSLSLSGLILCLGLLSASYAIGLFRSTQERQMAEDSQIIGESLRIIIHQVTQEYTDQEMALARIQKVLEALKGKGWEGFACVLDKNGRVLAHPRPELVDMQVPLETYAPTALLGAHAPPIDSLSVLQESDGAAIYRTDADIIAIRWLPELMTYLCVHQPNRTLNQRIGWLRRMLTAIGLGFIGIAATGAWFFVGRLVDRYESHLSRSEARNRVLVQNSAPILVVASSGAILDANPQAESLFGAPRAHLLQICLEELWLPDRIDQLEGLLQKVGTTDTVERDEFDMRTLQGRTVPVDLRACRIDYGDRDAVYLLIRDVTESRRARDEILEANRKLRELDQLKTDFINMVSHELRTPLTSIKWSSESLASLIKGENADTAKKLQKIIRDDNQRLLTLIEQLLSFSRLDAGKLKPNLQTVDFPSLLQQILDEVSPIAQQKGVDLMPAELPDQLRVQADPEQIHRAIVNILDNAIKYTPRGGQVHLQVQTSDGWAELAVKDTGIGIPDEDHTRIFEKFYRTTQTAVARERGTGLGLAIVKGIVDAHSGQIHLQSAVGSGTTLTVRLPLSAPPSKSDPA